MTFTIIEPNAGAWDQFVSCHPHGNLLQTAPWGYLKATSGWQPRRLAVVKGEKGAADAAEGTAADAAEGTAADTIVAGTQLLIRRRYGVSVVYVPRGPLFSGDADVDNLLFEAMVRVSKQQWAVFLRVEPHVQEDDPHADSLHSWLLTKNVQCVDPIQPRSTIHVDLTPPLDEIFAHCSKGHRADIRRAERRGVAVRVGTLDDMQAFYDILRFTGERASFGIHTQQYYHLAWGVFGGRSRLLLADDTTTGAVVAAHMVFRDGQASASGGRMGYYFYSGATNEGLKSGANHLLQWHALQWAKEQGCHRYDLWGIPDALGRAAAAPDEESRTALEEAAQHDPLIGVYRFKKGFGGRIIRYLPAYDHVLIPPAYAWWRRRFAG